MPRSLPSAALQLAFFIAACSFPASAQDRGNWRAASSTAKSITGDIAITDGKLYINFFPFTLAQIRKLQPAETGAVFVGEGNGGGAGALYRLSIPASKRFLRHNSLCGSEETQWMVTSLVGGSLDVAFFSGSDMPVLTPEAMANSTDLCGTFSFVR